MDRRFLTAKEVAELLRTTPGHLANQRMRGEGPPYFKFERRVLYEKRDVDVWLERHKVKSVDEAT
jgi:hypothetical protein